MQTVIKRLHHLLHSLLHHQCFLTAGLLRLSLLLVGSDVHEELSDFVSVLTRSGHFNGTSPVEVEVTQRVRQMLQLLFSEVRVVLGHKEVRWQHTALGSRRRRQEEIKLLGLGTVLLNETLVNDAA